VVSTVIDFDSRIDSNLKLRYVAFDSKRNFYTQIYYSTNLYVNLSKSPNIYHFTFNLLSTKINPFQNQFLSLQNQTHLFKIPSSCHVSRYCNRLLKITTKSYISTDVSVKLVYNAYPFFFKFYLKVQHNSHNNNSKHKKA
jgi:hypothetical protein